MINIVAALDENYAPHTAALIASVFSNSTPGKIEFYLLADNLSDNAKEKFARLAEKFRGSICIIDGKIENFFVSGHLSKAAYLRLKIPELLPESVKKTIYLDADLLVKSDISELFDMDMGGKPIAAVPDLGIMASRKSMAEKAETLGIKADDPYFNSGVMIMDLDKWRNENYTEKILNLAKSHNFRHHDQDALNKFFYNDWHALPLEFNVIPPIFELSLKVLFGRYRKDAVKALRNAKIVHYAGGHKPWHYKKTANFNDYYYEMLAKTDFDIKEPNENRFRKYREMFRMWRGRILVNIFKKENGYICRIGN